MKNKRKWYIAFGVVGALAVVGLLFTLNLDKVLLAVGITQPAPVFSYDEQNASGWWATKNYNSRASMRTEKDYQGDEPIDKLPVASMNVFKGEEGDYVTACFVMFSYYDYKTDVAKLKAEKEAGTTQGGPKFQNVGDVQSTISTPEGVKSYILTKYELSGPGAENSMKGMSYGWVELNKGHIQVSGVCPTAAELVDTIKISEAVSLTKP